MILAMLYCVQAFINYYYYYYYLTDDLCFTN